MGKYITQISKLIGNLELIAKVEGEECKVDVEQYRENENICWILADNLDQFIEELNEVINKYRI